MYRIILQAIIGISLLIAAFAVSEASAPYSYKKSATVIGAMKTHTVKKNDSLIELARRYGLGYHEIVAANPGVDAFVPGEGKSVNIPTTWILPDTGSYDGIVINLSEMRLYFFSRQSAGIVRTFPIGIGSEGNETPVGVFTIVEKKEKPAWYVPESIRKEKPELPLVVPPGPNNPLGSHALRLSARSILIHGTNRPYAVGRKASHGCIRMYPEDIPKLFQLVPNGAKVTIIRQPVKVGVLDDQVFLEVHKDKNANTHYFNEAVRLLVKSDLYKKVDKDKMLSALRDKKGFPVNISQ
jgi:L,D-transpeptidase ErfK/SrfK